LARGSPSPVTFHLEIMEAILALEDGRVWRGRAFGASAEIVGEVVFNTAMTGYQEILTDPSYCGQIVTMTYPLIGNYGVNEEDIESRRVFAEGLIVRELSRTVSNWRSQTPLDDYLRAHNVPGISDIDTRSLVRHIRERGSMRGCLSTISSDERAVIERARSAPDMVGLDLASAVTCSEPYIWTDDQSYAYGSPGLLHPNAMGAAAIEPRLHVVAYDFGLKHNSLRNMAALGCRVTVVPAHTSAEDVIALKPDGIWLSNGPGDPEPLTGVVANIRKLMVRYPVFGICLGHQLMGLAVGGRTYKLPFGHHGGNQPVKDLATGRVEITAQNHGFAVDADSLPADCEVTHINLNDNTVEGLRHKSLPAYSVQYHPEAGPGPHDAAHLFDEFVRIMEHKSY
ncbi:MAG TPA: glutamine-hydrolyzing carbamoyl-phosphate synthase small subunit, partial [Blastocatellia bacterium]|nr:glutamine-hydrolyzing carbamoyl-phosphate synthase small subunit [Blastocatellia bacterium]